MRRFKIYDLGIKIFVLLAVLFLNLTSLFLNPVYAVDSTPSADIQKKLDILKQEIASKAAKLKEQINKKLQNKVYVGVIKSKSSTTLTLATRNGTKIVNINQDTLYEPPLSKKVTLKEEDSVATLGDVDETGVLTARKIVKLPVSNSQLTIKSYLWGSVISVSEDIATIRDKEGKNIAISISEIDTTVKIDQIIIATGYLNKNNILDADFIFVTGQVKPRPNIATPSAQEATKSPTKKP